MRVLPSVALAALVLAPLPIRGAADGVGSVRGRVTLGVPGAELGELGPTVVYLEPFGTGSAPAVPRRVPEIHQRNATFAPSFLAVSAGQTVSLPNDDTIYHNVFSYSKPNAFDLGLYPRGDTKYVKLTHPGIVRIYCSIHESMSATVFVAPSPHHALVRSSGEFEIPGVAPGRYRVRTWNERLPAADASVDVSRGRAAWIDLAIGEQGSER